MNLKERASGRSGRAHTTSLSLSFNRLSDCALALHAASPHHLFLPLNGQVLQNRPIYVLFAKETSIFRFGLAIGSDGPLPPVLTALRMDAPRSSRNFHQDEGVFYLSYDLLRLPKDERMSDIFDYFETVLMINR